MRTGERPPTRDSERPSPPFRAPPTPTQTGASLVSGGERLSGRACWNFARGSCAFGDACKYAHASSPGRPPPGALSSLFGAMTSDNEARPESKSKSSAPPPPLGYLLHKTRHQLGPDPSASLLVAVLEATGNWRRVSDPADATLVWSQTRVTGSVASRLRPGAFANHFPRADAVSHKHALAANLRATPGGLDAAPAAFALPAELEAFREADARAAAAAADVRGDTAAEKAAGAKRAAAARWVLKPSVGGEGRGVVVCEDAAGVEAALAAQREEEDEDEGNGTPPIETRDGDGTPRGPRKKSGKKTHSRVSHVAQAYVPRPLLVDGRKVDLRVYVLVAAWGSSAEADDDEVAGAKEDAPASEPASELASELASFVEGTPADDARCSSGGGRVTPSGGRIPSGGIRAYVYGEGLVRFAARPYDASDFSAASRLTNNAAATHRSNQAHAREGPDADAHFMRNWTFARLAAEVDGRRGEGAWAGAWSRVRRVCRVALAAGARANRDALERERRATAKMTNRFELLGLDVLLDEDLRAWLLEVNGAPSLVAATRRRGRVSEVHHALKGGLVADALNLVDPGGDAGPRIEEGETEVQAERRRARSGRFEPL